MMDARDKKNSSGCEELADGGALDRSGGEQGHIVPTPPGLEKRRVDTFDQPGAPSEAGFPESGSGPLGGGIKEDKVRTIHGLRWLLICIAIYTACFLYGLDTTIAADIQGPIVETLGNVEQLAWVGAGFPLGSICVLLLLGKLYNMFNNKWNFIATVGLFEAGSAVCGAAPTMNAMIVGRVIAGTGGSGIYIGSLRYVAQLTGDKERGFYMALVGAFWGLGSVLGPVIGGAFAESPATWRWAFYINLPIGALAAPALLLCLPPFHPMPGAKIVERLMTLDYAGILLGCGTWVSFLLAFTMAGSIWPWDDARTIATLVVFGLLLGVYVLQQKFTLLTTRENRVFPAHLLKHRTQVLLYCVTSAAGSSLFVVIYYLPLYFQFVNGDGAIMAAVRLLPFVCVAVFTTISAGSILHLIKVYMIFYAIAGVFLVAGGGPLMVFLDPECSDGLIYGLSVLIAVGSGLSMTMAYTVSSLTLPVEEIGAGLNLQNYAQIGSQVISLAVAGKIYLSVGIRNLTRILGPHSYSDDEISGAVAGGHSDLFGRLSPELRQQALDGITGAMQLTFVLVPVAGAIMLLAAFFMKREKLFV